LAWGRNKTVETISADELRELQERAEKFAPEKLVIVAGPTFGTVVKLLLFGAALGATGVVLLRDKSPATTDSVSGESTPAARDRALLARAKRLAGRARNVARFVAEAARPALEDAIQQGKQAAKQAERDLESDISKEEA
jgi:hypothetical protein